MWSGTPLQHWNYARTHVLTPLTGASVLMADVFCFPLGERIVGQGGTFGWTDGAVMAEEESDWYDSNKIGQRLSEAERRNKIAKPERKEKVRAPFYIARSCASNFSLSSFSSD